MKLCKTCASRDKEGFCTSERITEENFHEGIYNLPEPHDMLIYSYYENGDFYVGENFGCVHHKEKTN